MLLNEDIANASENKSGKFKLDGKGGVNAAKIAADSINEKSAILEQANGKCLLAASQGEEEAYPFTEEGHSIFTYYLLEGLKGNEESVNAEGKVTADSLGRYIYAAIMNKPENKRPKQTPIRKVEGGGDIVLLIYPELGKTKVGYLLKLLQQRKIPDFNKIRKLDNYNSINLRKANLRGARLMRAHLQEADLEGAHLEGAILTQAWLDNTKLKGAHLEGAKLSHAKFVLAYLRCANLCGADLSQSVFINIQNFKGLKFDTDTIFDNSLTDMPEFIEYVKSNQIKLVKSKEELIEQMKLRGYSKREITKIVEHSKLSR